VARETLMEDVTRILIGAGELACSHHGKNQGATHRGRKSL